MNEGYWYLATPYTKWPEGHEAAFRLASRQAALLLKAGVNVYAPIAHTHPIAEYGDMDKVDPGLWASIDKPLLDGARGVIYLETPYSTASSGMHHELVEAVKAGKRIVFMTPGILPDEFNLEQVEPPRDWEWVTPVEEVTSIRDYYDTPHFVEGVLMNPHRSK